MKYYSEEETKRLREGLEEKILGWPQVSTKKMFGCPCYQAKGKLFSFLVTKGIVITLLSLADRENLFRGYQTTSFKAGKKSVQSWVKILIKTKRDLEKIMPFIRKSYEAAMKIA